tara:strand:- start:3064 stop:3672 length:609 start_codon:yes stop_codon:yes gene_type:complete
MTQPSSKLGPVSIGGSETFGNSARGVWETLADIQSVAKGSGEWIDGLPTGTGQNPQFAHDHRGGVWGRPLGVGHSVPMVLKSAPFGQSEAETFLNVPQVASPNGEAMPDMNINGGYQLVDFYLYHQAGAGTKSFTVEFSVWQNGLWSAPSRVQLSLVVVGAAAQWTQVVGGVQFPAGLVRLKIYNVSPIPNWWFTSLVVPQR